MRDVAKLVEAVDWIERLLHNSTPDLAGPHPVGEAVAEGIVIYPPAVFFFTMKK